MKSKNSGVVLLLGSMSLAASMTVMAGSIGSDPIDSHATVLDLTPDFPGVAK